MFSGIYIVNVAINDEISNCLKSRVMENKRQSHKLNQYAICS